MKFKLDENIGLRGVKQFSAKGFDTTMVVGQGLSAASDRHLIEVCQKEKRCLVTLDQDFGNLLLFKPSEYSGIAVLRLPKRPVPEDLTRGITTLINGLAQEAISDRRKALDNSGSPHPSIHSRTE